jgi:hypothetical protein
LRKVFRKPHKKATWPISRRCFGVRNSFADAENQATHTEDIFYIRRYMNGSDMIFTHSPCMQRHDSISSSGKKRRFFDSFKISLVLSLIRVTLNSSQHIYPYTGFFVYPGSACSCFTSIDFNWGQLRPPTIFPIASVSVSSAPRRMSGLA